jgi:dCTP deaminase
MILPGPEIQRLGILEPYLAEKTVINGKSAGQSLAGYDIRINTDNATLFLPPGDFRLGVTIEKFKMPNDIVGLVKDKSSYARRGLSVYNTVIEPGWTGYLTLELANHGHQVIKLEDGDPIAQVIFFQTIYPTDGYTGKYQNQGDKPQEAIDE